MNNTFIFSSTWQVAYPSINSKYNLKFNSIQCKTVLKTILKLKFVLNSIVKTLKFYK